MRALRGWLVTAAAASVIVVGGCSASQGLVSPSGGPVSPATPSSPTSPTTTTAPSVPADGVTLGVLGFTNGPLSTFSLPRTLMISTAVDQPNAVTVVMSAPSLSDLADYLRRALPAAGYVVTAQDPAGTMTFTGQGWTGSVTGGDGVAAVTLSPQ